MLASKNIPMELRFENTEGSYAQRHNILVALDVHINKGVSVYLFLLGRENFLNVCIVVSTLKGRL